MSAHPITVAALAELYLGWCRRHRSPRTHQWYKGHLTGFLTHLGANDDMPAADLRPFHVVGWVDSRENWGGTYRRGAIVAVQRCLNWAEEMGHIDASPVKRVKKPPAGRRDNPMTPDDFRTILGLLGQGDPFRDFLTFVWHSGCRPQEARHVERRHVDLVRGRIVIPKEEAKGKRHPRVIYLHGPALEVIARLTEARAVGKLFRNSRGRPWTKHAVCNRMHRLSVKTGKRMAAYDARHGFATRKLVQGHDHLTVAELMGHRDGTMLAKVYAHLDRDTAHLKRALED